MISAGKNAGVVVGVPAGVIETFDDYTDGAKKKALHFARHSGKKRVVATENTLMFIEN